MPTNTPNQQGNRNKQPAGNPNQLNPEDQSRRASGQRDRQGHQDEQTRRTTGQGDQFASPDDKSNRTRSQSGSQMSDRDQQEGRKKSGKGH